MGDRAQRERGASLVGVVAVLVILGALGGMAAFGVKRLADRTVGTSGSLEGLTPRGNLEGGGASPGVAPGRPGSPAGSASTASCTASAKAVEQAAAAKHASDGTFAASVDELLDGRWLAEPPRLQGYDLAMEAVGGQPTGKVLVNGLPVDQGCAAPRSSP